jgi:nucleoside phosphorylase
VDVLLVTATKVETKATLEVFAGAGAPRAVHLGGRVYFELGAVNGTSLCLTQCEMGASGLGASHQAIDKGIVALSPAAVVMLGIGFGMCEEKQEIGEVLVSEQLRPYEVQRLGTHEGSPRIVLRSDKPHASHSLLNLLKSSAALWTGPRLSFGTILTGEKLVDNFDFRESLRALEPEAVGGEMEAAGLYAACHDRKVDWILVKAVCDWADGMKNEAKDERQALAAKSAATFFMHALHFVRPDWDSIRGAASGASLAPIEPASRPPDRLRPILGHRATRGAAIVLASAALLGGAATVRGWRGSSPASGAPSRHLQVTGSGTILDGLLVNYNKGACRDLQLDGDHQGSNVAVDIMMRKVYEHDTNVVAVMSTRYRYHDPNQYLESAPLVEFWLGEDTVHVAVSQSNKCTSFSKGAVRSLFSPGPQPKTWRGLADMDNQCAGAPPDGLVHVYLPAGCEDEKAGTCTEIRQYLGVDSLTPPQHFGEGGAHPDNGPRLVALKELVDHIADDALAIGFVSNLLVEASSSRAGIKLSRIVDGSDDGNQVPDLKRGLWAYLPMKMENEEFSVYDNGFLDCVATRLPGASASARAHQKEWLTGQHTASQL